MSNIKHSQQKNIRKKEKREKGRKRRRIWASAPLGGAKRNLHLSHRQTQIEIQTQTHTFGADEAPADVDVAVVAVGLLGVEVVGADDGGACDHLAAGRHALLAHVVGYRAAQAAHQAACRGRQRPGEETVCHTGHKRRSFFLSLTRGQHCAP